MEIVAFLPDEHRGYSIDTRPVYNCLADIKPTIIIKGGDSLDLAYLSHWNEMKPRHWTGKFLSKDYEAEAAQIDQIKAKLKPRRLIYLEGNHEHWVEQFLDKFPYLEGTLDVKQGLKLAQRGVEWVPVNHTVKIGHLYYMHGMYTNPDHAKKTALNYQRCVRYGHTHDHQVHSVVSPVDASNVFNAMSCGCLCHRNPEYNHGRPNKWQNGFSIAYVLPNGTFTDYFIQIIKGRFVWNGKLYA